MTMIWTDEIVEIIRQRAEAKASAREISEDLGRRGYVVSRCAVIGKARRAGITIHGKGSPRPKGVRKPKRNFCYPARKCGTKANATPATAALAATHVSREVSAAFSVEQTSANPIPIGDLNSKNCHWPMGGFADRPPYLYCGDPVFVECYCRRHFLISIKGGEIKETSHVRTDRDAIAAGVIP